jgi:membrane protease YdiL (CAAX protease family)
MKEAAAKWVAAIASASVVWLVSVSAPKAVAKSKSQPKRDYQLVDEERSSVFAVDDPDRARSDIGAPLLSFVLPGFDQWYEGQTDAAVIYTVTALGGLVYAANILDANPQPEPEPTAAGTEEEKEENETIDSKDNTQRKYVLGNLLYQGSGGFSAYHSFRSAVRTRQPRGQYEFLTQEETPLELLAAPFDFSYLGRSTTLIPLGIIGALSYLTLSSEPADDLEKDTFTGADAFFTGAYSLNAGTHEEAMFRGWIMPVMHEYWDSTFWSNAAQSVLFAAAHLNSNPQPIPQLLLGYHLGYVTQKNSWTLGEAIFIHTWWDVVAFATIYHYKRAEPENEAVQRLKPVLWLPPFQVAF